MGIVHTVKSRIELWRLERYTKRRSCQLPGYTHKERELKSSFKNMLKGRSRDDFKCSETYNSSSLWE
ncbi:hypothetical protein K450DRAFT_232546 [Umbelopsis ramanniana AG]|uniref:Uncharacterized protein n=1 Tax=Umbelopsis ramanniana AG TaxID=1314678 RepID=A0AAD5EEA3_UMBRA|nr:uncharacterized protein K450DRAFT_232546 [Umbelopsis ramanniana AG]KAI8581336.1 hypothetical protein K450DRAFT_232546 [Umbelopsis ramanniana AG]